MDQNKINETLRNNVAILSKHTDDEDDAHSHTDTTAVGGRREKHREPHQEHRVQRLLTSDSPTRS